MILIWAVVFIIPEWCYYSPLSFSILSPWWRHQMETFSAWLALCAGNSPQRPVARCFDVFFDLRENKRLSKQSWGWWFETSSSSLWRHCDVSHTSSYSLLFFSFALFLCVSLSPPSCVKCADNQNNHYNRYIEVIMDDLPCGCGGRHNNMYWKINKVLMTAVILSRKAIPTAITAITPCRLRACPALGLIQF